MEVNCNGDFQDLKECYVITFPVSVLLIVSCLVLVTMFSCGAIA